MGMTDGNGIRDTVAVPDLRVGNTLLLNLPTGIQSQELVVER
jgi:aspartyl-tRNA synthetase